MLNYDKLNNKVNVKVVEEKIFLEVPKRVIDKNVIFELENKKNFFLNNNNLINKNLMKLNSDEDLINELVGKKRSYDKN